VAAGVPGNIAPNCPVFSANRADRDQQKTGASMRFLVQWLIDWPRRAAAPLAWLAPLFARITVGYVFLLSGWGKLHNLAQVTENFIGWGVPYPRVLTPFALGIVMIVAIRAAKWADVDSLETLLGFDEFEYLALFLWLAIAGPGPVSVDYWVLKNRGARGRVPVDRAA
jgi:putative oxidoreductase